MPLNQTTPLKKLTFSTYDDLKKALEDVHTHFTSCALISMLKQVLTVTPVGNFGGGTRNHRGESLLQFLLGNLVEDRHG